MRDIPLPMPDVDLARERLAELEDAHPDSKEFPAIRQCLDDLEQARDGWHERWRSTEAWNVGHRAHLHKSLEEHVEGLPRWRRWLFRWSLKKDFL